MEIEMETRVVQGARELNSTWPHTQTLVPTFLYTHMAATRLKLRDSVWGFGA